MFALSRLSWSSTPPLRKILLPSRFVIRAIGIGLSGCLACAAIANGPALAQGNPGAASATTGQSAFADEGARTLLSRARSGRIAQDSALGYYKALANLRVKYSASIRAPNTDRLLMLSEQSARVTWSRQSGVTVERTGVRNASAVASADLIAVTPIPYWIGRDALWMPVTGAIQTRDLHERLLKHPLADSAEQFYRYARGDSLTIGLADGRAVRIHELKITPLRADWHFVVGSFWFEAEQGNLVRAAYRLAADIDVWEVDKESHTGVDDKKLSLIERMAGAIVKGSLQPLHMQLNAVTIEYSLHDNRFWLPKSQNAEGLIKAGAFRLPITWDERFRYDSVSGVTGDQAPAQSSMVDSLIFDDTGPASLPTFTSAAAADSLSAFYNARSTALRVQSDAATAKGDTARATRFRRDARRAAAISQQVIRQRDQCLTGSTYSAGTIVQEDGALRIAVRLPCNTASLDSSPDLSSPTNGDSLFASAARDALLRSLNTSLQPGWKLQLPSFLTGLSFLRYNRVEGVSLGAAGTSQLGRGYVARAVARYGFGDDEMNGELSLSRSNGASSRGVTAYHRLSVANDLAGAPLSFGASVGNLLFARDEGFYFRSTGFELTGDGNGLAWPKRWRLFAEQQRSAGTMPNTQGSLANSLGDVPFGANIDATNLRAFGAGVQFARTFGSHANAAQLNTNLSLETALTQAPDSSKTSSYARAAFEATLFGDLSRFTGAITTAAGTSIGAMNVQRAFFLGGLYTVRGQSAIAEGAGRIGNSFWLTRTELGLSRSPVVRPVLFHDAGWAGSRSAWKLSVKPLSGAGAGLAIADGLIRFDAARGLWPEKRWRYSLYFGTRY